MRILYQDHPAPHGRPSTMQIITRQRCLHAANYRYSWRSSVVMIVLSALTYGAVVFEAARAIDEQGEHDGIR